MYKYLQNISTSFFVITAAVGVIAGVVLLNQVQDIRQSAATLSGNVVIQVSPTSQSFFAPGTKGKIRLSLPLQHEAIDGYQMLVKLTGNIPADLSFVPSTVEGLQVVISDIDRTSLETQIKLAVVTRNPSQPFSDSASLTIGDIEFSAPASGVMSLSFDPQLSKVIRSHDRADILLEPTTFIYSFQGSQTSTPNGSVRPSATPRRTANPSVGPSATPNSGTPVPTVIPTGSNSGLKAIFYHDQYFTRRAFVRRVNKIQFNWWWGSPSWSMRPNTFSVRLRGYIEAPHSGQYTFYTYSDDGVKLKINNQVVVDDFNDHKAREKSGTITLEGGKRYPISVDYYENKEVAILKLFWSHEKIEKQIVPASAFFSE